MKQEKINNSFFKTPRTSMDTVGGLLNGYTDVIINESTTPSRQKGIQFLSSTTASKLI